MNIIAWLGFQLAYYDSAVNLLHHEDISTPTPVESKLKRVKKWELTGKVKKIEVYNVKSKVEKTKGKGKVMWEKRKKVNNGEKSVEQK